MRVQSRLPLVEHVKEGATKGTFRSVESQTVWCVGREMLIDTKDCPFAFRTGWRRMEGVNYPLSVCWSADTAAKCKYISDTVGQSGQQPAHNEPDSTG